MFGSTGKMLRIDLSQGGSHVEEVPFDLARDYIGGRGLGAKILFDEIDPRIDPLSPKNKLIFTTGPLVGTGVPASGRFIVVSKSPLSGTIANPCCGGYFGANLKFAGYDHLIIEGRSSEPVYVYIRNDAIEIRPAGQLWGKWSTETERLIRSEMRSELDKWELNNLSIATIGPAGENLVRFACIIADGGRAAGRSGMGAVMGSKNLKAVVVTGTQGITVADAGIFMKAVADFLKEAAENGELKKRSMWGTWRLPGEANKQGLQCTRNFQSGYFEGFTKFENPAFIRDSIRIRDEGCFSCPFRCGKRTRIPGQSGTAKGPEHETMALVGSNCGIGDLEYICKMNHLCNELGIDTITMGASASCVMELFEKGYLPEKDIGYPLKFGDAEGMLRLLMETATRRGFGDLVAEGGYSIADRYGHPELFMGVKKLGMPAWHPQGNEAFGLHYATSNVGACHTKTSPPMYRAQVYGGEPTHALLAQWAKEDQDYQAVVDSAILCWIIYHGPFWNEKILYWLRITTGLDYTENSISLAGERIWNLERIFNLKAGISKKDDCLPRRMTHEPRVKGQVVHLAEMLSEYYRQRGWDENGVPTAEKRSQLGLVEEQEEVG